jgi:hypothetical protein
VRIYYCPTHGRVTEEEFESVPFLWWCDHCHRWYHRIAKFKAKRTGES